MRLLFDQNISFRIVKKLSSIFPDAEQLRELQLENFSDNEIWNYAKSHNYSIVTYDSDFYELSNLYGFPPKIIWLRVGNTSTATLPALFIEKANLIEEFLKGDFHQNLACLGIDD